jgi:hypothetical protein
VEKSLTVSTAAQDSSKKVVSSPHMMPKRAKNSGGLSQLRDLVTLEGTRGAIYRLRFAVVATHGSPEVTIPRWT